MPPLLPRIGFCTRIADGKNEKRDLVNIVHKNAQSVFCHKDQIEMLIKEKDIDILCISEMWREECVYISGMILRQQ